MICSVIILALQGETPFTVSFFLQANLKSATKWYEILFYFNEILSSSVWSPSGITTVLFLPSHNGSSISRVVVGSICWLSSLTRKALSVTKSTVAEEETVTMRMRKVKYKLLLSASQESD